MLAKLVILVGGIVCAVAIWRKLYNRPREWEKFAGAGVVLLATFALTDTVGHPQNFGTQLMAYAVYFVGYPSVLIGSIFSGAVVAERTRKSVLGWAIGLVVFFGSGYLLHAAIDFFPETQRVLDRWSEEQTYRDY